MRILIVLSVLFAFAAGAEVKTGAFQINGFNEYAPIDHNELSDRSGWPIPKIDKLYKLKERTFEVFVPENYDKNKPYGLIIWISSGDSGKIPAKYKPIFTKHNLIWIGANNSGNKTAPAIRGQLALDARHNMIKLYNLDTNRIYISGASGGAKAAGFAAFTFPSLFSGGIFCIGIVNWSRIPGKGGTYYSGMFKKKIPADRMKIISEKGRYACMTGDKDFNKDHIKRTYDYLYSKELKNCEYYQVPGLGHKLIPPEWYEKAIKQLDKPLLGIAKNNFAKATQLLKHKKYSEAIKYLKSAVAYDVKGAQEKIDEINLAIDKETKEVKSLLDEKEYVKSFKACKKLVDQYGDYAHKAGSILKSFNEDKKLKAELIADDLFIKASYYFQKKDTVKYRQYANALMKKYPESEAAKKAKSKWGKK